MIRTSVVELTTIPAVAYRQKLPAGGSGVTILRYGEKQVGIASISTRSGKAIPAEMIQFEIPAAKLSTLGGLKVEAVTPGEVSVSDEVSGGSTASSADAVSVDGDKASEGRRS